jgi:predicted amidohydrolase
MTAAVVRLAVVQPRTIRPDEHANLDRAATYARQAGDQGAQMVAFPECYPGPYSGPLNYSAAETLGAVAREYGLYLAYGFMEAVPADQEGESEAYHNVYQVIGPDGTIAARYAKMIPSPVDAELSNKTTIPGAGLTLVDTPWGKVGLLICWEAWFPELCRTLAMRGADVVLFPTGGMLYHLAPVWGNLIQARATENLVFTACCVNLFGVEDGFAHICAPEGALASSTKEGVLVADLDLARLRYLREEDETLSFPKFYKTIPGLWRYHRPDLYQPTGLS